jgi:Chlorophyll A-B binding protein
MLAMAGWVFPEAVAHLPDAAYSQTNPLAAVSSVGFLPMAQIFLLCVILEGASWNSKARNNYEKPGEYGWDVFGLMKSGGSNNHYRKAEIKNGRLAMCVRIELAFIFPIRDCSRRN